MTRLEYPIVVEPLPIEDGGGFVATAPDLPGCMSDGATPEEAVSNIQDAIAVWIEAAPTIVPATVRLRNRPHSTHAIVPSGLQVRRPRAHAGAWLHSAARALRSSLPRSLLGSAARSTIRFGALKAGNCAAQNRNSSSGASLAPGRSTT
jgi:antitoxin HicB